MVQRHQRRFNRRLTAAIGAPLWDCLQKNHEEIDHGPEKVCAQRSGHRGVERVRWWRQRGRWRVRLSTGRRTAGTCPGRACCADATRAATAGPARAQSTGAACRPELATPTLLPASTILAQSIVNHDNDTYASVGPGQANFWDLRPDFCIEEGWNGQFAGALALSVKVGNRSAGFDGDQAFADLTPLGPEMTEADGMKVVSITTDTQFQSNGVAAFLHPVPDARLQQTLDLRQAVGRVNLGWSGMWGALRGNFSDESAFMQVVLRDTGGGLIKTLFKVDSSGTTGTWGFAWLTAYAGQVVVLSFEQCNRGQGTSIEIVSVNDEAPRSGNFLVNGDFSAGLSGWTVSQTRGVQNVRSAPGRCAGSRCSAPSTRNPTSCGGA
jgi:hypothetical protein